jgi:hypothetical protein
MKFWVLVCCFTFWGTLHCDRFRFVEWWNSKVNQLSSPVTNLWSLFFSWALRMDNNFPQVSIRICRKQIVHSCGISRKWLFPSDPRKWLKIVDWKKPKIPAIDQVEWKGCSSSNARIRVPRKLIGLWTVARDTCECLRARRAPCRETE